MNNTLSEISVKQLQKAIKIKAKMETLQAKLDEVLGGDGSDGGELPVPFRKKRRMSAAGRAAIAAGVRKRWANYKGKADEKPAKKGKRRVSAAVRAKMAAAARARWKAAKAAGKSTL